MGREKMSSQDVIKSTARKLKYYMEVKRLEDAFDLSAPDKPQRHYPTMKPRPTLLYDGLHDRALKHYFRSPEVKKHLAQMNPKKSYIEREDKVRRDVDKYMSKAQFTGSASHLVRPRSTAPRKRRSNFRGGDFNLRSKHGPYITKGEAERLVEAATRLLVSSETVPLDNNKKNEMKKKAMVYRIRQNGDREILPYISNANSKGTQSGKLERPKSTYGIRPTKPPVDNNRPKSALALRPLSSRAHPSTMRYGYDTLGRRIKIHSPPGKPQAQQQPRYTPSESETDDASVVSSERSMSMLVPVGGTSKKAPQWLNIKMSKVSLDDQSASEEEEEEGSYYEASVADPEDANLYSIDSTTQTQKDSQMQTVEHVNSKDTQTRRANTIECLTDPYQADMAMQTDPPPISSGTQTIPPPPCVETQTEPPLPCVETQTDPPLPCVETQTDPPAPSVETQTLPPPPCESTQTMTIWPEMSTQTMPEQGTQTLSVTSTQTAPPPPEAGTQVTPSASSESEEEETYEHLQHGPKLKSGKRTVYEMAIHTGNRLGASTKADIHVVLFGEKGNTGKIKLKQTRDTNDVRRMKFQKGQIDVFKVESFYVGRLECILIGHNRNDLGCGWFLDKVLIREFGDNITYEFICERWLSAQDDDARTERTLPVANIIMEVSSSESEEETDIGHSAAVSDTDHVTSGFTAQEEEVSHMSPGRDRSDGSRASSRSSQRRSRKKSVTSSSSSASESDSSPQRRSHRRKDHTSGTSDSESDSNSSSSGSEQERGRVGSARRRPTSNYNNSNSLAQEKAEEKKNYKEPVLKDKEDKFMLGFQAGLKAREEELKREEERKEDERERVAEEEAKLLQGPSIHDSCKAGNLDRVKKLINHTPELKMLPDERGWTPLHMACSKGRLEIVKWLVINDVPVNDLTPTGYSGMHISAMNGHIKVMMILAALGVDVDCKTVDDQTPLHLAAMSGHLECCKWLIGNRASLQARDNMDRTPMQLAADSQHEECVTFFKSCRRELKREDSSLSQLRTRSPSRGPSETEQEVGDTADQWESPSSPPPEEASPRKDQEEKRALLDRKKSFTDQQTKMNQSGMSFLDSIRAELEADLQQEV